MKAGWAIQELGEVCHFQNGLWKGKKGPFVHAGVFRNTNFRPDGSLDDSDVARLDVEERHLKKRALRDGDIILEKSGGGPNQPVGRVAYYEERDGNFSHSNFTSVIRVKQNDQTLPRYLHKFLHFQHLKGATEEMQRRSTGIRNLELARYKAIPVPIPPLEEQRRIVAILDEARDDLARARANIEVNLADAAGILTSFVHYAFESGKAGWPTRPLAEVCENLDCKRVPITKKDREAGNVPYYGASGVVDHVAEYIFDEELLLVSEDGANLLMRTYPIAFSISGKAWVNNHAHVLRFADRATQAFVEIYLNSIPLDPYVSGMAQPKLNQRALNSIRIPLPAKTVCADFVARYDAVAAETKRMTDRYESDLADLADLQQSLLERAFAGELT